MILNYIRKLRKQQRTLTFHRKLIKPGDLIFDLGAHEGNRTSLYQYLGATILAVEPQSEVYNELADRFLKARKITVLNKAVADIQGKEEIMIGNFTELSSFSDDFIQRLPNFHGISWNKKEWVETTTLDLLIQTYGVPNYIKIDVEGYEAKVLKGLSTAINIISFEYNFPFKKEAQLCINILNQLGNYRYNFMPFEEMVFQVPQELSSNEMIQFIEEAPDRLLTGEVFAFLVL